MAFPQRFHGLFSARAFTCLGSLKSAVLGLSFLVPNWDPEAGADIVLKRLVKATAPEVKGAHDAVVNFIRAHNGSIRLCVTQGDTDSSRKERSMFGCLE